MSREQPGFRYVLKRLKGILASPVEVFEAPRSVEVRRDLEVPTRDGRILRANLFLPPGGGRHPVLISFHPYGKDNLPRRILGRYRPLLTYRLLRQSGPFRVSSYTGWEAPDPAVWAGFGYAVLNADMRGFFRSEGEAELLTVQEGLDYYDLIQWAAGQDWCTGAVGLSGVSYLAITQWRAASLRPPSLRAICPWEGFTDVYHDLAFPGGVRERGFTDFWFGRLSTERVRDSLPQAQTDHPQRDGYWEVRAPDLSAIEVPALICGSFSDHNLHSGGSFRGFAQIGSEQKWLYTHRSGKWAEFYSDEAVALQRRFFDHFLKGVDNGMDEVPPVRLEVRESGSQVWQTRWEREWPLQRTQWSELHLTPDGSLLDKPYPKDDSVQVQFPQGRLSFCHRFESDTEITGPIKLKLRVAVPQGRELCLFVGIRKLRGTRHVVFEGSYGFAHDLVTRGWLRLSPGASGEWVEVAMELLPSATLFRAGEVVRLDLQGRYFFKRHPLLGQFPAGYETSPEGTLVIGWGEGTSNSLLLPVIPQ